jgi:uroporphyrinogen decarboxylase
VIGFPRLGGTMLGEYVAGSAVAGLGIDTATDLPAARLAAGPMVALQGNLDPLALLEGGAALRDAVAALLESAAGAPFIFNLGHGVLPATPPAHVAALVAQVQGA